MLADGLDSVIGVDTHRDEHVAAVLTAAAGAVVAGKAIGANGRRYRETLRFGECHAAGRRAWAIEGTGSYGAGLARYLAEHRETVLKVSRTLQAERRLRGQGRLTRRRPHGPRGARQRHARAAASIGAQGHASLVARNATSLRDIRATLHGGSERSSRSTVTT